TPPKRIVGPLRAPERMKTGVPPGSCTHAAHCGTRFSEQPKSTLEATASLRNEATIAGAVPIVREDRVEGPLWEPRCCETPSECDGTKPRILGSHRWSGMERLAGLPANDVALSDGAKPTPQTTRTNPAAISPNKPGRDFGIAPAPESHPGQNDSS